jgi:perosamine synthetase
MKIALKPWSSIGKEEEEAALRVLRSGCLSGHLGGVLEGGPEVQALEREWSELNGGYSVAVNSATSGLLIALKAVGVGPGKKVICSPYSMSAGVACVLWCGAEPVFADIGDDYCLDLREVYDIVDAGGILAVLTTNLFGNFGSPPNLSIPVIEDNAQAPFTHTMEDWEGFIQISVDSFNVHKPMQAGEGGICTVNDPDLAYDLKLLRNHGELGSEYPQACPSASTSA